MILRVCMINEFIERMAHKRLVCYGAGKYVHLFIDAFKDFGLEKNIDYIVDKDSSKWGTKLLLNNTYVEIHSPNKLFAENQEDIAIFLAVGEEILCEVYNELNKNQALLHTECYCAAHLWVFFSEKSEYLERISTPIHVPASKEQLIPKKLHYCWLGKNPIPKHHQEWMESWRCYCPDYEIIEWNESNYDFTKNKYMKQAYEAKVWGFVPDYARLDIIYEHGGVYLDTDVEIVRSLDDLLYQEAFCGFESKSLVNPGSCFGAKKGNAAIKKLRDFYEGVSFYNEDGTNNLTASPVFTTKVLETMGLVANGKFQMLEGLNIYPPEYFSPLSLISKTLVLRSDNTYSIHWYEGSWLPNKPSPKSQIQVKELYKIALKNEKYNE